jgi:hypothetical protein
MVGALATVAARAGEGLVMDEFGSRVTAGLGLLLVVLSFLL